RPARRSPALAGRRARSIGSRHTHGTGPTPPAAAPAPACCEPRPSGAVPTARRRLGSDWSRRSSRSSRSSVLFFFDAALSDRLPTSLATILSSLCRSRTSTVGREGEHRGEWGCDRRAPMALRLPGAGGLVGGETRVIAAPSL